MSGRETNQRAATLLAALAAVLAPGSGLAQEPLFELEGVVVTATPVPRAVDAIASHVTVLQGAELRDRGIVQVLDALREVGGLHVVQGGSFGSATSLFLRGGESDYVLVLVDGVQVNQPGGAFDFSGLTTDNVERIEVVRGPASALYGSDAMAGVVHVVTRRGRGAPQGAATLRAGSFGRLDTSAELSGGSGSVGYGFSLARRATDGILDFNNASRNTVLSGSVQLRPDEATTAQIAVRVADREFHFPTDGSGNVTDENAFTFGDETTLSLRLSRVVTDRINLRGLVTVHDYGGGSDDQPDGPADTLGFYGFSSLDDLRRQAVELRADMDVGAGSIVTLGAELEEERQKSFSASLSEFGPSNGRSENERWNRATFLHAVADRGRLAANAGLRLEDNERFGSFVTYQVGASLALSAGTRVRASMGRGVKEPTFFENFAEGFARGNPELEPERSTSWEAGVDHATEGGLRLRVTYFDQAFRDLIQYTAAPPSPESPNYFNVAEASARGIELGFAMLAGRFRSSADYTYLDTGVDDSGFDEGEGATFVAGAKLLRRPAHTLALRSEYPLGARTRLHGAVRFVGERDDRDFSTWPASRVPLERYTTVDVGAQVRLFDPRAGRPGVEVIVRGENLLDESYEEVLGFAAPGRGLYAGARISFGGS